VPLVGDSRRWAAGAILLLGIGACGQGSRGRSSATWLLGGLGTLTLVLGVIALVTGSLTPLSLLVVDIVALWFASTVRHTWHFPRKPLQA
jgi:hypothetical protein